MKLSERLSAAWDALFVTREEPESEPSIIERIRRMESADPKYLPVLYEILSRYEESIIAPSGVVDQILVNLSDLEWLLESVAELGKEVAAKNFWRFVFYPEDMSAQQVRNELIDFHYIMEQVSRVYDHVTGGMLSKPHYSADEVIVAADDYLNKLVREAVEEATKDAE